jgi:hypothetical protein
MYKKELAYITSLGRRRLGDHFLVRYHEFQVSSPSVEQSLGESRLSVALCGKIRIRQVFLKLTFPATEIHRESSAMAISEDADYFQFRYVKKLREKHTSSNKTCKITSKG